MAIVKRYLHNILREDALADGKMAFISGPRQVGKTYLAKGLIEQPANYFSWDATVFRQQWVRSPLQAIAESGAGPVVFDEIHKYLHWKNSLKGLYDQVGDKVPILVTGSARLDLYKRGGDSLLGRYIPYRLHPLSVAESSETKVSPDNLHCRNIIYPLETLINCTGFPEPLLRGSQQKAKRWSRLRLEQLVREDVRDFKNIRSLDLIKLLAELLPGRVGSPLSINSLKEDLQVAYATIRDWMGVLQDLYICFKVPPFSRNIARALTRESKYYMYDWSGIQNHGALLENIVALHLLKSCHYWTDCAYDVFELCYIRTKEKEEVDFCIVRNGEPWMLVECKTGSTSIAKTLVKFAARFPAAATYQTTTAKIDRAVPGTGIRQINIEQFCSMFV